MVASSFMRGIALSGLAAGLFMLGGCTSLITGVYSSDAAQPQAQAQTQPDQPAPPTVIDFDPATECPSINVPSGATFYGNKGGQVVISNFARECNMAGAAAVAIKVGVEGHAVSTAGDGGSYSAPLRITIRDREERVVYTRVIHVTTHPGGDGISRFQIVDTSTPIPISFERPLKSYDITVGFDGKGMAPASGGKKKRRG